MMNKKRNIFVTWFVLWSYFLNLIPVHVAMASWLCPTSLVEMETAELCAEVCGTDCYESGVFVCETTDADGNSVFTECVDGAPICPIGAFQCDPSGTCRAYGECTSSSSINDPTHFCAVTGQSFMTEGACITDCFYESFICSVTGDQYHGATYSEETGWVREERGALYEECTEHCFSCEPGMYYYPPQDMCIQQICDADDPYCPSEVVTSAPICPDGVDFVFDVANDRCVKQADYLYHDCELEMVEVDVFQCSTDLIIYRDIDAEEKCEFHCGGTCNTITEVAESGNYVCSLESFTSVYDTLELCGFDCKEPICAIGDQVDYSNCAYTPGCTNPAAFYNPESNLCEEVIVASAAYITEGACQPYDVQTSCDTYYSHSDEWICKENAIIYTKPALCKMACVNDNECIGITSVEAAIEGYVRRDVLTEFSDFETCDTDAIDFCNDECIPTDHCIEIQPPDYYGYECDLIATEYSVASNCSNACSAASNDLLVWCQDTCDSDYDDCVTASNDAQILCQDMCTSDYEACISGCEGDSVCEAGCSNCASLCGNSSGHCTNCSSECMEPEWTCTTNTYTPPKEYDSDGLFAPGTYDSMEACESSWQTECFDDCRTWAYCSSFTRDDTADWTCSLTEERYPDQDTCLSICKNQAACVPADGPVCPLSFRSGCADEGDPSIIVDVEPDAVYDSYIDNGEIDADGNCLGQIYLFNGQVRSCMPSGWKTGFNDCCDADEDTVNNLNDAINAGSLVIKAARAVYAAQQAAAAFTVLETGTAFAYETAVATYGADATAAAASSSSIEGAATTGAIDTLGYTSLTAFAWAVVIAVVLYVVTEFLMQACDADDIMTAAMDDLGLCHFLEKICTSESFFGGCLQRTKFYCCFNTKLAKILHEQGRPILQSFADLPDPFRPTLSEGSYECRGFTPTEFQMLDFTQIDLSDYYGDLQDRIESTVQDGLEEALIEKAEQTISQEDVQEQLDDMLVVE